MNRVGFTLVELLVGMSLSILLMVSVTVFVTSGMQNITHQKQILDQTQNVAISSEKIQQAFLGKIKVIDLSGSGVFLQSAFGYGRSLFSYIGVYDVPEVCDGETQTGKYLGVKNFFPFEGVNGDLFAQVSYQSGLVVRPFDSTIEESGNVFSGSLVFPSDALTLSGVLYVSDSAGHAIYESSGSVGQTKLFLGNMTPGNEVGIGKTRLNLPTGLAQLDGGLLIADTGNDRILYASGGQVYQILGRDDGLDTPTGLYVDASKKIYIVNSGKKEVLLYDFNDDIFSPFSFSFIPDASFTANKIDIDFVGGSPVLSPLGISDFSFQNITPSGSDVVGVGGNKISYQFSSAKTFVGGVGYSGAVQNIAGSGFSGSLYANITLSDSGAVKYSWKESYKNFGDRNIFTRNDNQLKVFIKNGGSYPTGMYASGGNIYLNDFFERKRRIYDMNGTLLSTQPLSAVDFSALPMGNKDIRVADFQVSSSGGMLHVVLKYFKTYDCRDPSKNTIETVVIKKQI